MIATDTHIRADQVALCADYLVPVYIEKPVGFTPDQVHQIFDLPGEVKRASVIGFMMCYHPVVDHVASSVPEKVSRSHLTVGHDVIQWHKNCFCSKSYAARPAGGGVLLDLCHELDLACLLAPDLRIESISCLDHKEYRQVDMAASVTAFGAGLGLCTIELGYLAPKLVRRGAFEGLSEMLDYNLEDSSVSRPSRIETSRLTLDIDHNQLCLGMMQDLVTLTEQKDKPVHPLCPTMDRAGPSSCLIAQAWSKRKFVGQIEEKFR